MTRFLWKMLARSHLKTGSCQEAICIFWGFLCLLFLLTYYSLQSLFHGINALGDKGNTTLLNDLFRFQTNDTYETCTKQNSMCLRVKNILEQPCPVSFSWEQCFDSLRIISITDFSQASKAKIKTPLAR